MSSDSHADRDTRFWRLDTFSDAIFAVAMTLLVFTFPLAGLPRDLSQQAVQNLLQGLSNQFETFVISFLVVAAFWTTHHRVFDAIKRYDQVLVWINFVFLLFIVFIPFPTAVLVSATSSWLPVAFYAANIACAGLVLTLAWIYASYNHRLIDARTPVGEVRLRTFQGFVVPSVFLFSILVAVGSPSLAMYFWLLSFVAQWAVAQLLGPSVRPASG